MNAKNEGAAPQPAEANGTSEMLHFTARNFAEYLTDIVHDWSKVLTALAFTLVPAFFLLDYFLVPRQLLPMVGLYRGISTTILLIQYFFLKRSAPGHLTYLHGYLVSLNVGFIISLMTVDLGGFNSSYYAGLNLVIIGVNLLLPWKAVHSAANTFLVVLMYVVSNALAGKPYDPVILANNLFFLLATAIIAVSINQVKYRLVRKEFSLMVQLKKARDAMWGEMELAKRIQTALLPSTERIRGYEMAAVMYPAAEVGGDCYDIIKTSTGEIWLAMGDVSGHGVDSGLIMMMAQTSVSTMVNSCARCLPSQVLQSVNTALRENINRLGADHYMSLVLIRLGKGDFTLAGKHQDVILYRASRKEIEIVPTSGTWLGIADDIGEYLDDRTVGLRPLDIILLFSDGITEAMNAEGEMFGQERLEELLALHAALPVDQIVSRMMEEVRSFCAEQTDDMSIVVARKTQED
jgi:serine phosphatase RsbU (regulator of sigma subunit)